MRTESDGDSIEVGVVKIGVWVGINCLTVQMMERNADIEELRCKQLVRESLGPLG